VDGYIRAFDSRTGRQLWRHDTGRPIGGGIVSYQVDGRQYVAVPSGMSSPIWRPRPGTTAQIIIYRLP
jgi:alcohol dehydrogenase (cytochrome c)